LPFWGATVFAIRWSYLPSFLPVQCRWKLLQLAIFLASVGGTYINLAVRLRVAIFVQAPVLILVCGFLAYVATSILVWLADLGPIVMGSLASMEHERTFEG
jgi:hypothetical protein